MQEEDASGTSGFPGSSDRGFLGDEGQLEMTVRIDQNLKEADQTKQALVTQNETGVQRNRLPP